MTLLTALFVALFSLSHANEVKTTETHAAQVQMDPLYRVGDAAASREDVEFVLHGDDAARAGYAGEACKDCGTSETATLVMMTPAGSATR